MTEEELFVGTAEAKHIEMNLKAIFLAKKCDSSITALYVLRTAFDNPNLIYVPQTQNELKK